MDNEYVVWKHGGSDIYCYLDILLNVDNNDEIRSGKSLINGFPANACFHMDESYPRAIKLSDNMANASGFTVISQKLMEFIKSHNPESVEFLPVTINNHKGLEASRDYFIMNPLIILDCIDLEKTEVEWDDFDEDIEEIWDWDGVFTLDVSRIDKSIHLFRPKYHTSTVLVRKDLAKSIEKEGFTRICFVELDKYRV